VKEHVLRLDRLTPGDVAAVVRQYELWDETPDAREFYRRLAAEVGAKREEVGIEPAVTVTHQRKNATAYG